MRIHSYLTLLLAYFVSMLFAPVVCAEMRQSVTLRTITGMAYHSVPLPALTYFNDYWHTFGLAKLSYSLESRGSPWVRGMARISVSGTQPDGMVLELSRAFIRSRISVGDAYIFQMELGKNRIAWGEGYYYNAGDVIFGVNPRNVSITESKARNYALWQLRFLFPLGVFMYIEPLFGIPEQRIHSKDGGTIILLPNDKSVENMGTGIRFYTEIGPVQWETGLYSKVMQHAISPYMSISLPLIVKWYIAGSFESKITPHTVLYDELYNTGAVSMGLQYFASLGTSGGNMDVYAEMLYQREKVYLHPSITWNIKKTIGLYASGILNFFDTKYSVTFGPRWNPADGFTILLYTSTSLALDKHNTLATTAGLTLDLLYTY